MEREITVRELFQILRRGRYIILAVTAVAVLLGAFYGFGKYTPAYRSSSIIDVSPYTYDPDRLVGKGRVLLQQEEFLDPEKLDIPAEAIGGVRLEKVPSTDLVKVEVVCSEPEAAFKTARVVGEKLLAWASLDRQRELERKEQVLRAAVARIDTELAALENKNPAGSAGYLSIVNPYHKLLEARAEVAAKLYTVAADREKLATSPELQPANFVYSGQPPGAAGTAQRLVYPAAAFILGLVVSGLLVFLRYWWRAGDWERPSG